MNNRMIQANLSKKFNDFLSSITDDKVKEMVASNSIISGGAITSMFLGEKVKDYDIYFTNKEACLAVTKYYVEEFYNLNKETVIKIKPEVIEKENRIRINIQSIGVAGEETVNDEDEGENPIFSMSDNLEKADNINADKLTEINKGNPKKYQPIFLTDNAITLSNKVQLIIRFYGTPSEIHKNYDFIHCTNYWNSHNHELILKKKALNSLLTKNLYYVGSLYPLCSLIRMRKFLKKGWHINAGEILKIALQISSLDLYNVNVLAEQLIGVDTNYFRQMIHFLQSTNKDDNNKLTVDYPYIVSLIDKIF